MMRGLKLLLKVVGILLAVLIAIIGLWLAIAFVGLHSKTEGKITAALESGFPGAELSIHDREDWGDYGKQICFDVTARPKSGGPTRRAIVMVQGDIDGGTWRLLSIRYSSMRACEKDFFHG